MTVFVKNYIAGCAICQQMKINTHPSSPGLIPIKGQKDAKPFSQVTCDFITDLPKSDGFDSLMVIQKIAERSTQGFTPFKKGEQVWLDGQNLKIGYQSRKLAPKREGPFMITEVLGPITYRLKLPNQWRIHDVFHASLLSPYRETKTHGPNFTKPPPDLIKGKEEYEIEAIMSHKKWG